MTLPRVAFLALLFATGAAIFTAAPRASHDDATSQSAEASRLNNIGVAYMNQQLFEKALKNFEAASAQDPSLHIAKLNCGVALLNLQKIDDARSLLEDAAKQNPKDANAWYNLGLLYKNTNETDKAAAAFQRVTEIDPNDADTWYFLGSVYAQSKQYPQAIQAFEHALKLNPLHASAEFGISRAYQQSGDPDHAREHLKKFQYIKDSKLGSPMSLAYGEQGKYSRAEESPGVVETVPPQIPVKFVDVTKEAGLSYTPVTDPANTAESGACFHDYDNDGKIDLFLPNHSAQGRISPYHNLGNGKFDDVTKQARLDPATRGAGCTTGDYDNDGFADIAVAVNGHARIFHNEKNGTFKDATETAGLSSASIAEILGQSSARAATALTFIDYDHDGDLDLFTACSPTLCSSPSTANEMWRNNGDGTFTQVTHETGIAAGVDGGYGAIGTDYNNDRAVDLLVSDSAPAIFENPREGKFIARKLWSSPMPSAVVGVAVLDFNHDGWMDVAFTHMGEPGISLWRNNQGKTFDRVDLPATNWVRAFGIDAFDYDNDGWVDLVAVGETKDGKGEVRLFRNLGPNGWKDVTTDAGLDKIQLKDPRAIITGDYDNDGAVDLLITQNHGPAVLLRNEGGNQNNWLRLNLKGLNDNKSAIGTKVEIFSGGNRQKFEIYGSNGYLGQNSPYLTVGLGQAKQADIVRMLWPTGVLQDEIEVAGNQQKDILEIDRRGSSCPTLFVWDGKHYELVADILGAGVVGHWVAPGERNIARPTEWVKINRNVIRELDDSTNHVGAGALTRPVDRSSTDQGGSEADRRGEGTRAYANNRAPRSVLSFRLMEPMEEVVYLDAVKLLAVDHPASEDVYPNEYFASNPPYPEFKVVTSSNAKPPTGAWDDKGNNLLPDLLAHKYVGKLDLLPFKGFTKPHSLILDLGEPYRGGPLHLLMHGEIEYFTATGMYAASQAGIEGIAPYVEAQGVTGKWIRVLDDMGFPAGLPKTITVDLTGKLPQRTQKIRITTNLQIYWDNILIDRSQQKENFKLREIPLTRANLDFHGYPRQIEDLPPGNVKYVYEQVSRTGPYARQAGEYTRYGDVRALLSSFDDKLVVFGSGEEVALEFDPAKLPALPMGWTRDYFFMANGYEKDMDFYAAGGNTVEPLPFRRMGTYPYRGKSFPFDDEHLNYLLQFNTRFVS